MQTKLHKALAVLLTLAMLCTLLPLSVAAADVEMLVNGNFETGNANGWTLTNASGQKLGASSAGTVAFGSGTTTWTISISNTSATIQNTTSSYGSFRFNASSPRFNTYTSKPNSSMLLPQLYIRSAGGNSVLYTTSTTAPEGLPGDINGDGTVNREDVIQLLLYVSAPGLIELNVPADFNGDGKVTRDDVIALLLHVSSGGSLPLF